MLPNHREFIKTRGLKGFRKSEVEVIVRSPEGRERQILLGEIAHIRPDKRRRKRRDYVTLFSISRKPRLDLTYNIATHRLSFNYWLGYHHGYAAISEEDLAKLCGALEYLFPRYRGTISNKLEAIDPCMPLLAKWYYEKTRKSITFARRAWFKSAKAHRHRKARRSHDRLIMKGPRPWLKRNAM